MLYVAGGWDGTSALSTVVGLPLLTSGQVGAAVAEAALPSGRRGLSAVSLGGVVYALGGRDTAGTGLFDDALYAVPDASGSITGWTRTLSLPGARSNFGAVAMPSGIYVVGGMGRFGIQTGGALLGTRSRPEASHRGAPTSA